MPPSYQKSRLKMRTLLGNSLYRRLALWAIALFTIASILLLKGVPHGSQHQQSSEMTEEERSKLPPWSDYKQ